MGDWCCDACGQVSVAPFRTPLEHDGMGLCGSCHTESVWADRVVKLEADLARVTAERDAVLKDSARLDWLEGELDREANELSRYIPLFRRNRPITRDAIDSCTEIDSWDK